MLGTVPEEPACTRATTGKGFTDLCCSARRQRERSGMNGTMRESKKQRSREPSASSHLNPFALQPLESRTLLATAATVVNTPYAMPIANQAVVMAGGMAFFYGSQPVGGLFDPHTGDFYPVSMSS